MAQKIKLSLLILAILVLGFIREGFFRSLNAHIRIKSGKLVYSGAEKSWTFFENLEIETLQNLKWLGTFFFALAFLALTIILIKVLYKDQKLVYIIVLSYAGVFILAAMAMMLGKVVPSINSSTYYFSRWLMGAAQSPLLPAILVLIIFYTKRLEKR